MGLCDAVEAPSLRPSDAAAEDIAEAEFQRLAALTALAITSPVEGPRVLFATDDLFIGKSLFKTGAFDADEFEAAMRVIGLVERGGRVFVDVGANIGTTTLSALSQGHFSSAHCFEPDLFNCRLLTCNLLLNGLEDRATVYRAAVSDEEGELLLTRSPNNRGDHRVIPTQSALGPGTYGEEGWLSEAVAVVRLDDALRHAGVSLSDVGVVWVDTQGHEAHVLEGAWDLVAAGVPFVVEYWPYGLRRADGLERFHALVAEQFSSVINLRDDSGARFPATQVASRIGARLGELEHTDLVLLP